MRNNACNYPLMRTAWNYVGNVVTCLKSMYNHRSMHIQIGIFSWDKTGTSLFQWMLRNTWRNQHKGSSVPSRQWPWRVTPCSLVDVSEKGYCLHLQVKIQTLRLNSRPTKKQDIIFLHLQIFPKIRAEIAQSL